MSFLFYTGLIPLRWLLSFYLLGTVLSGHTQIENSFPMYQMSNTINRFDRIGYMRNYYPDLSFTKSPVQSVDSISQLKIAGSHFARIYSKVMTNEEQQITGIDSAASTFIRKFEIHFADYFLQACKDDMNGNLSSSSAWKNLFSNPSAQSLRLTLMGINAHVNGDIWQTLVNNFPEKEIRLHKKAFLACQSSIVKVYYPFFDSIALQSWYLKFMRSFTKGLVKNLGERILYKWRHRQVSLAILYYHDHEKFEKRLAHVNRKKEKIDQLLLHGLNLIVPKNST